MASYINGITTYIPQIQPSDVNLQIESQYANMRQSKHDAARQQISNLYGSLLNSPLSREDNNIARDNFFKTIEGDIKRISGMDLSLQQNVTQAQSVFNQLLDDKYILKDMAWTKNFQNQVQISDYLKNVCTDSAECDGMWWDGGDRLLQYQMEDFQNATADDSLRMGDAHYIAKQDVTRMALDFAKQYDVDMTVEQSNGQYIFTQKNGQIAAPVYSAMFNGMIAQNPKVMEYYNAKARVQRLDYMHQHAEEFGSMEAAEQDYINKMLTEMSTVRDDNGNAIQSSSPEQRIREDAENAKTQAERKQAQAAGLQVTASQIQDENKSAVIAQSADKLSQQAMFYEREYDRNNNVVKRINRDANNQTVSGAQIDEMLAKYNMDYDIGSAVLMASLMNSSVTMREDKYGLERYKASLAAQQQKQQQTSSDSASLYQNRFDSTELGGTQIEKDVDLFEGQTAKVADDYSNLKSEISKGVNKEFATAVNDFLKSDEYKNLPEQQKKALVATYRNLSDVQKENLDLTKDIIQPLFSSVSEQGKASIDESIDILNKLSDGNSKLKSGLSKISKTLTDIQNSYKTALDGKQLAIVQSGEILDKIDAFEAEYGDVDNKSITQVKGLLKAYKDGNIKGNTMVEKMAYMHSDGFSKYIDENVKDFFTRNGKDELEMSAGAILSIINSSGDENMWADWDQGEVRKYLIDVLEKNGIEKIGGWFDTYEDFQRHKTDAFTNLVAKPLMAVGDFFNPVRWFSDDKEDSAWNMYEKQKEKAFSPSVREEDFYFNNESIFEKDDKGNKKIENGDYVISKAAREKLNKPIKFTMPYQMRKDYINNDEAIIRGEKEFRQSYVAPNFALASNPLSNALYSLTGFGSEDTTLNFNDFTNQFARKYSLLSYNGNNVYHIDSNGNLATQAFTLNLTNKEDSFANELIRETFADWSRGTQINNLKLCTTNVKTFEDANENDDEFRTFLKEHGVNINEFMNQLSMSVERMAKSVGTNKDGTPKFYDEDNIGLCTYSAMALGNPNFSVLKVDTKMVQKLLNENYGIKADEIPNGSGLYIYNNHGQKYNQTSTTNGYSKLDGFFTHSETAKIVDSLNGMTYHGLRSEYANDIEVKKRPDGYLFSAKVPVDIASDNSLVYKTITSEGMPYGLDDGFDLAWKYWEKFLQDYTTRFFEQRLNRI